MEQKRGIVKLYKRSFYPYNLGVKSASRADALADVVRQSKAYLRRNARRLPAAVVAQLKDDLERNERQLEELTAKK